MATGDSAYIKKINRSLIIKKIVEEELISRADLSKIVNLTRATISVQVANLIEEDLIVETHQEHLTVGRKPIMLSLNGEAGYALGIDLDYGKITFTLSDLLGIPISTKVVEIDTTDYDEILRILIDEIKKCQVISSDRRYGIVGIVIAIHGLVAKDEVIYFVPRFHWQDIRLKTDLEKYFNLDIFIENNANLSAFAERVYDHHDAENLLSISLYSGIGLGMMTNSDFFRGHDGFAGEAGHMIIVPHGRLCNCGNHGCWEQYSSETSLFNQLSKDKPNIHLTNEKIHHWLAEGDQFTHKRMEELIYYLTIGLNNMINVYNPDVVVLNSELLRIYPDSLNKIKENLSSSISHYRELSISKLGKKSCVMGACALAIKHFLKVPMLNLSNESLAGKHTNVKI